MVPALDLKLHWTLAGCVVVLDILVVAAIIIMDKWHHVEPPVAGGIDTSAAIGWLGVLGAVFIFGCYGILIKTPSVQETKCDCMVFQCYSSLAVVVVSLFIWAIAGSEEGMTLSTSSLKMGVLFGALWIVSQICAINAVRAIGYAVAPAIWIGVTILTSFFWGVVVFRNPVHDWQGAMKAMALMLSGVFLAAASSMISDRQKKFEEVGGGGGGVQEVQDELEPLLTKAAEADTRGVSQTLGIMYACLLGLCNGSLMVPVACFQDGCPSLGVQAYSGNVLAPLSFLPSLAAGIALAHPILFMMYWGQSMMQGEKPKFHVSAVATPAFLTGAFWGMGNFAAMFASTYLGQVVGFPLTQCCLVVSGAWGVAYFKEIQGTPAVGTFTAAAVLILAGATLDGLSV